MLCGQRKSIGMQEQHNLLLCRFFPVFQSEFLLRPEGNQQTDG